MKKTVAMLLIAGMILVFTGLIGTVLSRTTDFLSPGSGQNWDQTDEISEQVPADEEWFRAGQGMGRRPYDRTWRCPRFSRY